MPWIYEQSTGKLWKDGEVVAKGYSGCNDGKNNCDAQEQHNVGPIPVGSYTIGPPRDINGGAHGPYVLPLVPASTNEMFGRSGFLIHGDNIHTPGTASEGCIIMDRGTRTNIWASGDLHLEVISKVEPKEEA
jgi:hypothetical protein